MYIEQYVYIIFHTLFIYTELITGSCTELLMSTQIIDGLLKARQKAKLYRRSHAENCVHLKSTVNWS